MGQSFESGGFLDILDPDLYGKNARRTKAVLYRIKPPAHAKSGAVGCLWRVPNPDVVHGSSARLDLNVALSQRETVMG